MVHGKLHRKHEPPRKTGWTQVLWKGKQFLFTLWHRLSCMMEGRDYNYDKRNTFVVVCDTDIP